MHEVHVLFPPAEYFDGIHSSHVFVIIDAIVPGPQYSHSTLPALLATYPFVLSQGKQALAAAPECFPTSHFAHASALLPLNVPGSQMEQIASPSPAYLPG
jgi:hypothetical protein